ncbi:MAG: hypothetical protein A3H17_02880 [Candidatus Levybacteria bacterium RIFCSPLOWO2_12_FULL_37_14]|nr:MAG: hypothetical protein A3H17_02880 [Candidatus Levybacteria bacterium RIFCSPLOWO2_12_FULL_37_14]
MFIFFTIINLKNYPDASGLTEYTTKSKNCQESVDIPSFSIYDKFGGFLCLFFRHTKKYLC